jgi:hypothetical protein
MKQYQDVTRNYIDKVVIAEFCDWCGKQLGNSSTYEYDEFVLYYAHVSSYPGCTTKRGWQIEDLCYDCSEKLCRLLKDAGIKISEYEVDWG